MGTAGRGSDAGIGSAVAGAGGAVASTDGAALAAADGAGDSGMSDAAAVAAAPEPAADDPSIEPVVAAPAADVDVVVGIGWIETNVLSQIIRLGEYHHFVKNVLNWLTVSFVFGRMS